MGFTFSKKWFRLSRIKWQDLCVLGGGVCQRRQQVRRFVRNKICLQQRKIACLLFYGQQRDPTSPVRKRFLLGSHKDSNICCGQLCNCQILFCSCPWGQNRKSVIVSLILLLFCSSSSEKKADASGDIQESSESSESSESQDSSESDDSSDEKSGKHHGHKPGGPNEVKWRRPRRHRHPHWRQ